MQAPWDQPANKLPPLCPLSNPECAWQRGVKFVSAFHFFLESAPVLPHIPAVRRLGFPSSMKAKIIITPKRAVLDPQGKTVQNALAHMGYTEVGAVHVGKYLEIELTSGDA